MISLKFGMWSTEVGGNVHSKICLVSSRQHRATEVRKLRFLSSCQYTHGVARRLLGPIYRLKKPKAGHRPALGYANTKRSEI